VYSSATLISVQNNLYMIYSFDEAEGDKSDEVMGDEEETVEEPAEEEISDEVMGDEEETE